MWRLIKIFLSQKKHESDYTRAIKEWLLFLKCKEFGTKKAEKALKSAKIEQAIEFIDHLKTQKGRKSTLPYHPKDKFMSNATIAKRIWLLQHLYQFLKNQDQVKVNPFYAVKKPDSKALQKRPTNALNYEDVRRLFDLPKSIQDQAILASLFGAALRRSELCKLRICDFQNHEFYFCFYLRDTKTKKDYFQAIGDELIQLISIWYEIRKLETKDHSEPLFRVITHGKAKPYNVSSIYKKIKIWASKLDLSYSVSPHSIRATAITHLLDQGIAVDQVRYYARHNTIDSTLKYDKRSKEINVLVKKLKI